MTDRVYGLSVVLDKEYRTDDVKQIIDAIKMIRGVADVKAHVADMDLYYAVTTARNELGRSIIDAVMNFSK